MNTKQLECAIMSDVNMKNTVIGVFSADRLPHLPPRRPIAFIANTDPATAPGRHWVAFFIDQQNVVESFDSYENNQENSQMSFNSLFPNLRRM